MLCLRPAQTLGNVTSCLRARGRPGERAAGPAGVGFSCVALRRRCPGCVGISISIVLGKILITLYHPIFFPPFFTIPLLICCLLSFFALSLFHSLVQ